jgi:hypothetical protein
LSIKTFPAALELAFWDAAIFLLTGSPLAQRLLRWFYHRLRPLLRRRQALAPFLAGLALLAGLLLGFMLGFFGLELLL